ncbi:hypothetical protein R1flu_018339 [Riccia fluitans]|uniref:Uncharacterized protein n=1 Tax=Riccia fluitans TaxID=41844 RepID=A0ABD1ZHT7_9MARC
MSRGKKGTADGNSLDSPEAGAAHGGHLFIRELFHVAGSRVEGSARGTWFVPSSGLHMLVRRVPCNNDHLQGSFVAKVICGSSSSRPLDHCPSSLKFRIARGVAMAVDAGAPSECWRAGRAWDHRHKSDRRKRFTIRGLPNLYSTAAHTSEPSVRGKLCKVRWSSTFGRWTLLALRAALDTSEVVGAELGRAAPNIDQTIGRRVCVVADGECEFQVWRQLGPRGISGLTEVLLAAGVNRSGGRGKIPTLALISLNYLTKSFLRNALDLSQGRAMEEFVILMLLPLIPSCSVLPLNPTSLIPGFRISRSLRTFDPSFRLLWLHSVLLDAAVGYLPCQRSVCFGASMGHFWSFAQSWFLIDCSQSMLASLAVLADLPWLLMSTSIPPCSG